MLSKFSVKKPMTIFVAVVLVMVLGVVSFLKMTPDLMPNMDLPYALVLTTYPGQNPETVETVVTKPLESSVAVIDGVEQVRFCYDCGHEHCYTEHVPFVDIFADRLICTHLHDNFGRSKTDRMADGDLHLLPFDGNVDYRKMIDKLDEYDYRGSLMLEVFDGMSRKYLDWGREKFVKEAFERVSKIKALSRK
jgi:hypothetical protein